MNVRNKNISGTRIKKMREQLGLSQDQLSGRLAKLGITIDRAGISKIETGIRSIYDFELKALAKILNVSADWLLGGNK
ncbi:MAG: helix-turn-helix transcriptional regulator [Kiritimatiellales bacterium]|nr:helix-turn-helix transcriptional regulator [Kiritimatiellota bacterium]MBL7012545.1 helix-turn-helix transcriptional regulator [Kiritimatiellales bacterium]